MKTRRYRKSGIGTQPEKGQFSYLPSDVWVEVDGGKQLGNETEFPPDPAREQEKAIIDEVNMLRNDVSQRAANELVKVAKVLIAGMTVPIEIGDTILIGKWKNRKALVKGFGVDELNQPIILTNKGEVKMFKFRIPKILKENQKMNKQAVAQEILGVAKFLAADSDADVIKQINVCSKNLSELRQNMQKLRLVYKKLGELDELTITEDLQKLVNIADNLSDLKKDRRN
jgi:hypothetical protein